MTYAKLKKKYALNNSYFKNRQRDTPSNPYEVLDYFKEHGELPYNNGEITDEWFYDCFVEYQKRAGVHGSQFFTPTNTAKRMVEILSINVGLEQRVLDTCCGFGQITKQLINEGYEYIEAFDNDKSMVDACYDLHNTPALKLFRYDFTSEEVFATNKFDGIISNPPHEGKELIKFLEFVDEYLYESGFAVLLIPVGFLDKTRPASLVKILNRFLILHREKMTEKFARTGANAEIVVLSK